MVLNHEERLNVARAHSAQLAQATGKTALLLPHHGLGEWDREGGDLRNTEGLNAFLKELRLTCPDGVSVHEVEGHINDVVFANTALEIFDAWCADGTVVR